MKIFHDLNQKHENLALALGFFDGVHLGHKEVIKSAVNYAKKMQQKSAVITFKEHPQIILQNIEPAYITTKEEKYQKFKDLGVDYCFELDFAELCKLSANDYIEQFLIKNFAPISISTGFNHYFGFNKSGSAQLLKEKSKQYGYKYFMIQPVKINEETVSSSIIRKKILSAKLEAANKMLGQNFTISGTVQKGANIARKIGFKTANILYPENKIHLPLGVYATETIINQKKYTGIANFGIKPTFENLVDKPLLEIHLLNFDDEIYNETLNIEFTKFIREEKKFPNTQELINQIKSDIENCI